NSSGPEVHELSDNIHKTNNSSLNKLISILNNMHYLSNSIKVDKLLTISEESLVCKVPLDNQIIKKFAYTFRKDKSVGIIDDEDIEIMDNKNNNSIEIAIVSSSSALSNLKSV
ncbi:16542_t:CDS:1, partial [Dentiscutata heterogama]